MHPYVYYRYHQNWPWQRLEKPIQTISSLGISAQLCHKGDQSKCMTDRPLDLSRYNIMDYNAVERTEDVPLDLSLKTFRCSVQSLDNQRFSTNQSKRHTAIGAYRRYHHKLTKDGKFVLRKEAIVYGGAESISSKKYEAPFGNQSKVKRLLEMIDECNSTTQISQSNVKKKTKGNIGNTVTVVNSVAKCAEVSGKHSSKDNESEIVP